jgi:mxaL protein
MTVAFFKDARFWLLAGALVCVLGALLVPRIQLQRDVFDVLAVVDITSSMNTRDMGAGETPDSRLDAAKSALRATLQAMPCQSRLGLALFTERQTFLLFDPVEVCENFAAIDASISELNWRMAWEGNSYVAKGLFSAIDLAKSLKADLIFLSDGHEAPPLPFSGIPPFEGERGEVRGLIGGIGGHTETPLTKYDNEGHEIGTYDTQEVPQENRAGPPPPDAESRPGYHPKWAPFGNEVVDNGEHLAFIREPHLQELARITGLDYVYVRSGEDLVPALSRAVKPRRVAAATDVRAYPAVLALGLLVLLYGLLPVLEAIRARPALSHKPS